MHGIQNLFRQHALDKQSSADSWNSAYSNGRSISAHDSSSELKTASPWSQGSEWHSFFFNSSFVNFVLLLDRVLNQLNGMSAPQPVPNVHSIKSPSQEIANGGVRWKRSSPDPNKMMLGRSPNISETNAKRILSTTPSRRNSHLTERVGSPSLSGYSVRDHCTSLSVFLKLNLKF